MLERRKSDASECPVFRSERFSNRGGQWYFITREGTEEGPFEARNKAKESLERYIQIMSSGFMGSATDLKVMPLD